MVKTWEPPLILGDRRIADAFDDEIRGALDLDEAVFLGCINGLATVRVRQKRRERLRATYQPPQQQRPLRQLSTLRPG